MSPDDFNFMARLLREHSGLVLTRDKGYLLENLLLPVVRAQSLPSLEELVARLRGGATGLFETVIDAMMAKDTGFFRDWRPFKHLRDVVLPNIGKTQSGRKALRVLSAGAGTGQEAYSVAMHVRDAADRFQAWNPQIVGVDISRTALAAAELGVYNQYEIQRGLPVRTLLRHFSNVDGLWRVNDDVRRLVSFQHWNLLDDLYPLGRFDVVLCRNVLIYFDQQTKIATLQKIARLLADDGVLYVGVDETVTGVSNSFHPVIPDDGIYGVRREGRPDSASLAIAR